MINSSNYSITDVSFQSFSFHIQFVFSFLGFIFFFGQRTMQTFCVVSKRFKKNYIHRFTGTMSLFLFEPWSKTRRICVYIATNQIFDYVVMATILFNCIFLAMTETVEEAE